MSVLGLDLSLTGSGLALGERTWKAGTGSTYGDAVARARFVLNAIDHVLHAPYPRLAVIEAPSYGSTGGAAHERAYLWWRVVELLQEYDIEYLSVAPSTIKKYATGKGNADKDEVMRHTCRRFPWFEGGNDEADALWAATMGEHHLSGEPPEWLPKAQQAALPKAWLASVAA